MIISVLHSEGFRKNLKIILHCPCYRFFLNIIFLSLIPGILDFFPSGFCDVVEDSLCVNFDLADLDL